MLLHLIHLFSMIAIVKGGRNEDFLVTSSKGYDHVSSNGY